MGLMSARLSGTEIRLQIMHLLSQALANDKITITPIIIHVCYYHLCTCLFTKITTMKVLEEGGGGCVMQVQNWLVMVLSVITLVFQSHVCIQKTRQAARETIRRSDSQLWMR